MRKCSILITALALCLMLSAPMYAASADDIYQKGQVLMEETFDALDSLDAGGYSVQYKKGKALYTETVEIDAGTLHVVNTANGSDGSTFIRMYQKPANLTEFSVSCDFIIYEMGTANANGYPGIMLNDAGKTPNQQLVAVFARAVGADPYYNPGINRYIRGSYTTAGSAQASDFSFDIGKWYTLKAVVTGDDITLLYADPEAGGDFIALGTAPNYREGDWYGLLVRGADVAFDNVRIESEAMHGYTLRRGGAVSPTDGITVLPLLSENFEHIASLAEGGYDIRTMSGQAGYTAKSDVEGGALRVVNTAGGSGGTTFIHMFESTPGFSNLSMRCDMTIHAITPNNNGYPGLMINDSDGTPNRQLIGAFCRAEGKDRYNWVGLNRYFNGGWQASGSAQDQQFAFKKNNSYTIKVTVTDDLITMYYRDNEVAGDDFHLLAQSPNTQEGDKFGLLARGVDATFDNVVIEDIVREAEKYYANNTACTFGPHFRDSANPVTDKWYTFTPIDLSADGVQTYDLIAGNMYVIGKVVVAVQGDAARVDYQLYGGDKGNTKTLSEYLTFFPDLESVADVDPDTLGESAFAFGREFSIENDLDGDTNVLMYVRNRVNYCNYANSTMLLSRFYPYLPSYVAQLRDMTAMLQ